MLCRFRYFSAAKFRDSYLNLSPGPCVAGHGEGGKTGILTSESSGWWVFLAAMGKHPIVADRCYWRGEGSNSQGRLRRRNGFGGAAYLAPPPQVGDFGDPPFALANCHRYPGNTPPMRRVFALVHADRPTLYTTNITPDPHDGIGRLQPG